jgi:hypothetical protein
MKANVGGMDKILRIVAGLVLIGLTLGNVIGMWGWLGVIPLATGLMNFCPLYPIVGFSSAKGKA